MGSVLLFPVTQPCAIQTRSAQSSRAECVYLEGLHWESLTEASQGFLQAKTLMNLDPGTLKW